MFPGSCANTCMNFDEEFYGHKNLLITQHKNGWSCTLFSKAQVCQSLVKIPNAAYQLVPPFRGIDSTTFRFLQCPGVLALICVFFLAEY